MLNHKRIFAAVALASVLTLSGVACSSDSGSASDFCSLAKSESINDIDPSDGEAFTDAMDKLEAAAPAEIKDDIKKLNDAVKQTQELKDDPSKMPDTEELKKLTDGLTEASTNVQTYLKDTCKIGIEG